MIVTEPGATPLTTPVELTVAIPVADELHVAIVPSCRVVPSLNVPTACNARFESTAKPPLAGLTAIESNVAPLTLRGADPLMLPSVAEMVVVPLPTAVATPRLPLVLLMVAAAMLLLAHVTLWVMFCVVESLKVPIAVKVCVDGAASVALEGPTTMELNVGAVTSSVTVPVAAPSVAVTIVDPIATASAVPSVAPTVATAVFDDIHVANPDTLRRLPSL
jgi:hypothetical protein